MKFERNLYDYLKQYLTPERIELFDAVADQRTRYLTVVLEDLYQPHNANAVLRNCECFGVQDIHIIENRNNFEDHKQVGAGSKQWLNLEFYNKEENNTIPCLQSLRKKGYKLVATSPHENDVSLSELNLDEPMALIFGTEFQGISEEVKSMADTFVTIPMVGFTESLNLSVSVALCLRELTKKLRLENKDWSMTEEEKLELKIEWAKKSIKRSDLIVEHYLKNELGQS